MTYYIRAKINEQWHTLFDIEFYMALNESAKSEDEKWYLELHSCPIVKNFVDYILKNINESNKEEFKNDCDEIDELRGWLWEQHDNKLGSRKTVEDFEHDVIRPNLEKIIYGFAKKWNMVVVTD